MTDQPFEFKPGDRVSIEGVVEANKSNPKYPLIVRFTEGMSDLFTIDGKLNEDDATPCLKLIERPKRKVTKTVEIWMNIYPNWAHTTVDYWPSKEMADEHARNRIACVKLTGSYEVEE